MKLFEKGEVKEEAERRKSQALFDAVKTQNTDKLEQLLSDDLDVNLDDIDVNVLDDKGYTPLHYAVESGNLFVIYQLLGRDANVKLQDNVDRRTPLHCLVATKANSDELVSRNHIMMLLQLHGVDVNAKDKEGKTALHIAVENNETKTVESLLSYGAAVNVRDNNNDTPLHLAIRNIDANASLIPAMMKLLLTQGASIKLENNSDQRPYTRIKNSSLRRRIIVSYNRTKERKKRERNAKWLMRGPGNDLPTLSASSVIQPPSKIARINDESDKNVFVPRPLSKTW